MTKIIEWVSASAGTGKTTYMIDCIANMIKKDVLPKSILCLSFSNGAVNEIKARLTQMNLPMPIASTIHALGRSMMHTIMNVTDKTFIDHIYTQAVDNLLQNPKWFNLCHSMLGQHPHLINEVRSIVLSSDMDSIQTGLKKFNYKPNTESKIKFSQDIIDEINTSQHKQLLDDILSYDLDIYSKFLNSNLKIKQEVMQKTKDNTLSDKARYELKTSLNTISYLVQHKTDEKFIKISLIFNEFIIAVSEEYKKLKQLLQVHDFNDLISVDNFDPGNAAKIQHIFLDEAQDTDKIQQKFLLNLISEISQHETFSVTIIGDPKQSIYSCNNKIYSQLRTELQNFAKSVNAIFLEKHLNQSRRITNNMLNFVRAIMKSNNSNIPSNDIGINECSHIKIWKPINKSNLQRADWIITNYTPSWMKIFVEECKFIISNGYKYSDITILFQKKCTWIHEFLHFLNQNDIPVSEYPISITSNEIVYEFIMIAELAINKSNDAALAVLLKSPFFKLSDNELIELSYQRPHSIMDAMSSSKSEKISRFYEQILDLINSRHDSLMFFSHVLFHTEYGNFMSKYFNEEVNIFWKHVLDFSKTGSSLSKMIEYMFNLQNRYVMSNDGIIISTIHNFKGRENEYVFLSNTHVSPIKNMMPVILWKNIILYRDQYPLYEEMKSRFIKIESKNLDNLLYVAMTRAKKGLYVLPPPEGMKIFHNSLYSRIIYHLPQDIDYEIVNNEN